MAVDVPLKYALYNEQATKQISLVCKIEDVSELLTSRPLFSTLRYGDPVSYGDAGLIYGKGRKLPGVLDILSLEGSSLTISQKLESEQGKSSISTVTLAFVDMDNFMTRLISPGVIVDDILGKSVTLFLGYDEISYPEDFFVVFRGKITGVTSASGIVTFQISDPNINRKQSVFYQAKTKLASAITNSATSIPVVSAGDFHAMVLGPNGAYDPAVKLYFKIEDEFIEYGPSYTRPSATLAGNTFTGVSRGARGTTAVAHASGADVEAYIQIQDDAISMALKLMLSGWVGPWKEGILPLRLGAIDDPLLPAPLTAIVLKPNVDADRDYGLASGEYITVSGSAIPGNNKTVRVTGLGDLYGEKNRIIYTDSTFTPELTTTGVLAFRSQFDTYPTSCGVKLTPEEVDLDAHLNLRNTFLGTGEYTLRFLLSSEETCKSFIESEILLICGAYSLTQRGRLSIGLTHPPLAGQSLQFLTKDNVLDPKNLKPSRAVNNRKFFNEIDWEYDVNDDGAVTSVSRFLDSESQSIIKLNSPLKISSKGARTDLGFETLIDRSSRFLLSRYKRGAMVLEGVKVNWTAGSTIEAGDVVALKDGGDLQISNFGTGERDLGVTLFEVIDRSLDIKSGSVSLKLVSGLGVELSDRYAVIAPSSQIVSGSTTTRIVYQDSFGAIYPGNEKRKWENFVGQIVRIRSQDYSYDHETFIRGFDTSNPYVMLVDALPSAPLAGYVIDTPEYGHSTDKTDKQPYKTIYFFLGDTIPITAGGSFTTFTVSPSDATELFVGDPVRIHNSSYSDDTGPRGYEILTVNKTTGVIVLNKATTFTITTSHVLDTVGYADEGGPYRWL